MLTPDSLIFDMDGTLWDAVDSYCAVWDATAASMGIARTVDRRELLPLMGKPLEEIYRALMSHARIDSQEFMQRLGRCEAELMPRLGGRLYPGVRETLNALSDRGVRLFMVSNCSASGLDNFLDFTGLRPLMVDALSFGTTGCDKDVNMRRLRDVYSLKAPAYVGDVQRDADSTHAAGLPFIWAAYGFGSVLADDYEYRIDSFDQLLNLWN